MTQPEPIQLSKVSPHITPQNDARTLLDKYFLAKALEINFYRDKYSPAADDSFPEPDPEWLADIREDNPEFADELSKGVEVRYQEYQEKTKSCLLELAALLLNQAGNKDEARKAFANLVEKSANAGEYKSEFEQALRKL